jgi:hypothetical protein
VSLDSVGPYRLWTNCGSSFPRHIDLGTPSDPAATTYEVGLTLWMPGGHIRLYVRDTAR